MTEYVCGFYRTSALGRICLIRKARPEWQKGKLNGVGGKMEPGESGWAAMAREFKEYTGRETSNDDWTHQVTIVGDTWTVYYFTSTGPGFIPVNEAGKGEYVAWHRPDDLDTPVPNLAFLIPLCLDTTGVRKPVILYDDTKGL